MSGQSGPESIAGTDPNTEPSSPFAAEPYPQRTLQSLRRITRAVDLYSRRLAIRHNVTGPQLACLRAIHGQGSMTSAQLARRVYLSPSTIVGILDRLEEKGWVVRQRSCSDRRNIDVSVTAGGVELLDSLSSPLAENLNSAFGSLPESEQFAITVALEKLISLIEYDPAALPGEDALSGSGRKEAG